MLYIFVCTIERGRKYNCFLSYIFRLDGRRKKERRKKFKGTPPPLFWQFLDFGNGKSDRAEIFTMDRASKKTRPMFEEKIFKRGLPGFLRKTLVFHRSSSCHCTISSKVVRLGWKFFCRYLRLYLRGSFELFEKTHFLFFLKKKYKKVFQRNGFLIF